MWSKYLPRSSSNSAALIGLSLLSSVLLVACGGGGSSGPATPNTFTVGGTASGLTGSGLVLQDNQGDNLTVSAAGTFTFATPLANGAPYAVTVLTQPSNPTQNCAVSSGSGTVSGANVTTVQVTCSTDSFTVGGTVNGLAGSGLVLQDNGGDSLPISASGTFSFATAVASGAAYAVTVQTQPSSPAQSCSVVNGSGTMGNANVSNVTVNCTTQSFTVSGNVTGVVGSGLVLQDNGGDNLPISASGSFTFATAIASGGSYAVTVSASPVSPSQACVVTNGTGTIGSANITNVAVACTVNSYNVGGGVTGLTGSGLVIQTNGANPVSVPSAGNYVFASLASGTAYTVSVRTQPSNPSQTCVVTNGTGTVTSAAISSVAIACTTNSYPVGGTVGGLSGAGLQLSNGVSGAAIPISGNGSGLTYVTLASNATYNIVVKTQPTNPSQTCVVANPTGTVTNAAITNVNVACTTNNYAVGGNVTGLSGTGLQLSNGVSGTAIPIASNGTGLTYLSLASNAAYNIVVKTQPTNPSQTCLVANPTGTVTNAPITNVNVSCTTNTYALGGNVSGVSGTGLALENLPNTTAIPIAGNGIGVVYLSSLASNTAYNIAVKTQPTSPSQTCLVANPTGTVTNAPITNVNVACTTNTYTIGGSVSGVTGSGLVLQNNGGDNCAISSGGVGTGCTVTSGNFTFATAINDQTAYAVSVLTQPTGQYCVVQNGTGTLAGASVSNVAVSCHKLGTFAYAADSTAGMVSSFTIAPGPSPAAGTLQYVNSAQTSSASSSPAGIAVTVLPAGAGTFVYTADSATADISIFTADPTLGTLTYSSSKSTGTAPATPSSAGSTPQAITIDPSGQYLLVADSQNSANDSSTTGVILVYAIDQTLGTLTESLNSPFATAATPGNNTSSVAFDPLSQYVFATNQYLPSDGLAGYTNSAGNLTQFGTPQVATGNNPVWVIVDPTDRFVYVSNFSDGTISGYTLSGGVLTPITTGGGVYSLVAGANPGAIAIDPTGRFLYVADGAHNKVVLFNINSTDGSLSPTAGTTFATGLGPFAVSTDPSGHFVYVGNSFDGTISMYAADPNSGSLTELPLSPLTYNDVGGPPTTTPAVGTNALVVE